MISENILRGALNYLDKIHGNYEKLIGKEISKEEMILADILTLNEEWGELNDEIKKQLKLSFNKDKVKNASRVDLEDELVDVYFSLYSLTHSLGISNLDEAVQRKIQKNNARGY